MDLTKSLGENGEEDEDNECSDSGETEYFQDGYMYLCFRWTALGPDIAIYPIAATVY